MSLIYPFAALRPVPKAAAAVASVPYDVVNTDEARALATGQPLSFLHVSRPEIDLPAGTDPHATPCTNGRPPTSRPSSRRRPSSWKTGRRSTCIACAWARTSRSGIAACFSIDEYDRDLIKKHEQTRRTRKTTARATCSRLARRPVRCSSRIAPSADVDAIVARVRRPARALRLHAPDGVRHSSGWSPGQTAPRWWRFSRIPASTSPTATTARPARPARAARSTREAAGEHDACSRWRFPTTRCRCCPTTASSAT